MAHRRQCLRGTELGASGASRTLVGRLALGEPYRAPALPLSYTGWSRRVDSNRHLSFTRAPFFPLNYFDMERVTGFEPVSGPWQGPILAARRYPRGASGENRTLLASLEGWNSANKSHSLELYVLTIQFVKEHTSTAAHGRLDPYSPDALLPDLSAVRTHWSGTPDSNREYHDPKSCGLSRFPSAREKVLLNSEGPVFRPAP